MLSSNLLNLFTFTSSVGRIMPHWKQNSPLFPLNYKPIEIKIVQSKTCAICDIVTISYLFNRKGAKGRRDMIGMSFRWLYQKATTYTPQRSNKGKVERHMSHKFGMTREGTCCQSYLGTKVIGQNLEECQAFCHNKDGLILAS